MTKELLKAEARNTQKKSEVKDLRKSGYVPGVLYGHHREPMKLQVDTPHMDKFLKYHGIGTTLNIEVGGNQSLVMIKDVQRDVIKGTLMHVDFQELTAGEKVRIKLPIHFVNRDAIDSRTTVFQEIMHEIEVQTLPKDLVETIDVDVSNLAIGDSLKVMDLAIIKDDKYEVLSELDHVVATLSHAKVATAESDEEETSTFDATSVPVVGQEDTEE